jgi:esterase/lipase
MGGLLALNACIQNQIAGVFLISTPMKVTFFSLRTLASRLKFLFYPKKHIVKSTYLRSNSISNINLFSCIYFLKPLREFYRLVEKTKNNLKYINVPVYMIHSLNDETTSFKSAEILLGFLPNAQALEISLSWHAYFEESERIVIREKLLEFIGA